MKYILPLLFVLLLAPAQLRAIGVEYDVVGQRVVVVELKKGDPKMGTTDCITVECIDRHGQKTSGGFWLTFSEGERIKAVTSSGKKISLAFADFHVGQKMIVSGFAQTPLLNIRRCVLLP